MTTSKYHPQSKPSAYPPLAPSVTCGASSRPSGAMGGCVIRGCQVFQGVPGQAVHRPVGHGLRPQGQVKVNAGPVPVQAPPFQPSALPLQGDGSQLFQNGLSIAPAPVSRLDIQILQVKPRPAPARKPPAEPSGFQTGSRPWPIPEAEEAHTGSSPKKPPPFEDSPPCPEEHRIAKGRLSWYLPFQRFYGKGPDRLVWAVVFKPAGTGPKSPGWAASGDFRKSPGGFPARK